jgi:hypothetical protein
MAGTEYPYVHSLASACVTNQAEVQSSIVANSSSCNGPEVQSDRPARAQLRSGGVRSREALYIGLFPI